MTRAQFPKRSTLPMTPESYLRAVREVRRLSDQITAHAAPQTRQEKAALTSAVKGLMHYSRVLWRRHQGLPGRERGDFRLELPKAERL